MALPVLSRTGILAFMDDESRERFIEYGSFLNTQPGQVIIEEGAANIHLYIVVTGYFEITTGNPKHPAHLDRVGPGDCLGEVAVFQPGVASATVTSAEAGQLWLIDVDRLQQFLVDWPFAGCAAVLGINTILSRRLKRANAIIRTNQIVPSFLSIRSKRRAAFDNAPASIPPA